MRTKDYDKKAAILQTAGTMINEEGISSVSMSKVAKAANISSSTIYVYFVDKDDMLKQVYLVNKQDLATALVAGVSENGSSIDMIKTFMTSLAAFGMNHYEQLSIIEQFNNSPMLDKLQIDSREELAGFNPLFVATDKGIQAGELKPVNHDTILTFAYMPVVAYVKNKQTHLFNDEDIPFKMVINMVLDAISK